MGYMILTDSEHDRAVLFDTTTERPLNMEAFIGSDCREQAEDFLDWLGFDPRDDESLARRGYVDGHGRIGAGAWYPALDHAQSAWHNAAFSPDDGEFVGHSGRVA
jgi:hypothetical protein